MTHISLPILLLLLFSSCAHNWTSADSYRQAAVVALQAADWAQTRRIATEIIPEYTVDQGGGASTTYNPRPRWNEYNPVLGEHPSRDRVDAYFAGAIVGHALISYLLPPQWRLGWQYIGIGVEAGFVVNNFNAGIRW